MAPELAYLMLHATTSLHAHELASHMHLNFGPVYPRQVLFVCFIYSLRS